MPAILLNIFKFMLKILKWGFIIVVSFFAIILLGIAVIIYCDYYGSGSLYNYARSEWQENGCVDTFDIDLAGMNCKWDTLYYYDGYYPAEEINNEHGTCFTSYDGGCKLVYKLRGRTVSEEMYQEICSGDVRTVNISLEPQKCLLNRDNAKFNVTRYGKEFHLLWLGSE